MSTYDEYSSVTWSHILPPSVARAELLITHIGNTVLDVVMLSVDEDGMPV